ncbi:MAG TPA: dipeptidase [Xanthobacteraceae bacterium]|nr:dipeptidase [Xanthobacteraceae bacterium]
MAPLKPVPIFDGHNDVLLRLHRHAGANAVTAFLQGEDKGHLDLPKALKGGFAGGLFAIFVPSPKRENSSSSKATPQDGVSVIGNDPAPPAVDAAEAQRAVFAMVSLLYRIERESQGRVRVCREAADIESCFADDALAAVLHIEGAEAIEANFELLDVLYAAGLRSLGPVWSRPNIFAHGVPFRCPSSPDIGPGLTDLGKALIGACNALRILIDLSHLNERGFWDVAELSTAPLVATHSNAHAISPHSRNLTDRQLAAIRQSGGLVGVNFATAFLRPDGRHDKNTPIELIVRHIAHLLEHLGEDGVGFGSDFDGAMIPAELGDAAGLQILVRALREQGFDKRLIEKLCFRNWLRVLGRTWEAARSK